MADDLDFMDNVDKGYAWVVLAANFFNLALNGGTSYLFGLFYPHFLDTFEASEVVTVSVASAQTITLFAVGILAGSLSDTFGCRAVIFLGALLTTCGLVMAAFATNIFILYLSYGLIAGFGIGLHYVPMIVSIQIYFKKKMTIAMGIASSGVGFGTFVFSPILTALLDYYGWRGAMLIYGGIYLHGLVLASLVRPLVSQTKGRSVEKQDTKEENHIVKSTGDHMNGSIPATNGDISPLKDIKSPVLSIKNGDISPQKDVKSPVLSIKNGFDTKANGKSNSHMSIPHKCDESASKIQYSSHLNINHDISQKDGSLLRSRSHNISYLHSATSIHNLSISNLGSVTSVRSYIQSSSHINEDAGNVPQTLALKFKESLTNMFDLKLYANVYVVLFQLVAIMMSLTHFCLYTFTPRYAESRDLSAYEVSFALSMVGAGDIIGRITGGILGHKLENTLVYFFTTLWCGSFFIVCSIVYSQYVLYTVIFVLAGGIGVYVSMSCTTLVFYVGESMFARVYGFILIGAMIGSGTHAPLGAILYQNYGSYSTVFQILSAFPFISSLILAGIFTLRKLKCVPVYFDVQTEEINVV